jgi:hypothetical protein
VKPKANNPRAVRAPCGAIVADKNYVEQVANAKAKGNRAACEEGVHRIGFVAEQPGKSHQRARDELLELQGRNLRRGPRTPWWIRRVRDRRRRRRGPA